MQSVVLYVSLKLEIMKLLFSGILLHWMSGTCICFVVHFIDCEVLRKRCNKLEKAKQW